MIASWLFAAIHLLAFGFALASLLRRTVALRRCTTTENLPGVFIADNAWGIASLVLVVTGVMRAFGGFDKGAAYYMTEPLFHLKMVALVLIIGLEIGPMMALQRWRYLWRRGDVPDLTAAPRYARTGGLQMLLLVVMVFAASGMARGVGVGLSF